MSVIIGPSVCTPWMSEAAGFGKSQLELFRASPKKSIFYATSDGRVRYCVLGKVEVCIGPFRDFERADRHVFHFRQIHRIAGDGGRQDLIGLCRHEVPLALLRAMEGDHSGMPSLSPLGGCRLYEHQGDDLQV
ncbi:MULTISPECIES: hypothetical protein [unclassified Mesorhizobium]|uniref:hypothetical protein n=1 Tax=unclassified Mesorhizobium TaxID=325217 RepID=UPI0015E3B183|nr:MULTISPECIES: hypothetical protein [unclassified Mesorhizobium]